jgi:MFS family permease
VTPDPDAPLFRNTNFLLLYGSQGLSAIGSQASLIAYPLLVLEMTHSPRQAGLVAAVCGIPTLLFSLPAGVLADRHDRRVLMRICELGRAIVLGTVAFTVMEQHRISIVHLVLAASIERTFEAVFLAAQSASLGTILSKSRLTSGTGLFQTVDAMAFTLGPLLGGLLFGVRRDLPFVVDTLTFLVSFLAVSGLRLPKREGESASSSTPTAIREGLRWVWGNRGLRVLHLLIGAMYVVCFGYALVLITLVREMGIVSTAAIGLALAGCGVGFIVGGLAASTIRRRVSLGPLCAIAAWTWTLAWGLWMTTHGLVALILLEAVGFAAFAVLRAAVSAHRLAVTPDHLRGRTNSIVLLLFFGTEPISLAVTGLLIERFGVRTSIGLLAVPMVLLSLAFTWSPTLRRLGLEDETRSPG